MGGFGRHRSRFQLWYGRDAPPAEVHTLRAGPVTAHFDGADLRRVRIGGGELAQRIYVAVRDSAWNTIPGRYSDLTLERAADRFRIGFTARHRYADLDVAWQGTIWLGLIETDAGSPLPDRFPSSPGSVDPLYHVFAGLAEWKSAELVRLRSTDPLTIEGMAVRAGTATHLLVANMTPRDQAVAIGPLEATRAWVRRMDEDTAPVAMTAPQHFRKTGAFEEVRQGALQLTLAPYAVVRIDAPLDISTSESLR